jgi:hypothetical protein
MKLYEFYSFTFESVQTHTDLVWRYERYLLIREYFDRPPLFPPFIILAHFFELSKLIFRHLPKHMKKFHAKTFSKKFEEKKNDFNMILFLLEMIGANREVNKDWTEFESYATNLYARSVLTNSSTLAIVPSKLGSEQQSSSNITSNNSQYQDIKTITDEITSVRKALLDLRTYSEEVSININNRIIIIIFCFIIER